MNHVQNWFSDNVEPQLEVRAPLKNTGYWNFLTIGGIYGRMLHFLLTDSDGYGEEIKALNSKFKNEYGDEYYTELESHVAEYFPIADTLSHSKELLAKISDIRDKKTKKTLGNALYILQNIANDRKAVKLIIDRWHMIKNILNIFKNTVDDEIDDDQINKLKILLLEHPEVFQKLMAQPDVLNRLSGSVLQSLKGIDLIKAVESVQEMALLLKMLYPQNYEEITGQLLEIRDEQTGLSFAEGLQTVSNVVKTQAFQDKLKKLLDTDVLRQVHETSQQSLAKIIKPDPKQALNNADPVMIQKYLETQGIYVSLKKTESLLQDAKDDLLIGEILRIVEKGKDESGHLTPESVSKALSQDEIQVSPKKVTRVMQLLQIFPPEMIWNTLTGVGIQANVRDLEKLVELAKEAAPFQTVSPNSTLSTSSPTSELKSTESTPSTPSETPSPATKKPSKL